jgi:hypothetical protein
MIPKNKMTEKQLQQLKEKFLNKKISLSVINDTGYGIPGRSKISGKCTFIGYNPHFPSWGLQVTINRTPIQNVDFNNIKLV